MALNQHLTALKGKAKYAFENTRYKLRQYRLTRGSGRTEQIFGMNWTTKILITLIVLLLIAALFYSGKALLANKQKVTGEIVAAQNTQNTGEQAEAVAIERAEPEQREENTGSSPSQISEPDPTPPAVDEEKENLLDEIRRLRAENQALASLLVREDELRQGAELAVLPETVDVDPKTLPNFSTTCINTPDIANKKGPAIIVAKVINMT